MVNDDTPPPKKRVDSGVRLEKPPPLDEPKKRKTIGECECCRYPRCRLRETAALAAPTGDGPPPKCMVCRLCEESGAVELVRGGYGGAMAAVVTCYVGNAIIEAVLAKGDR